MKNRFLDIICFALLVGSVSSCQTIQFERPNTLAESDWPTDGQKPSRSRYSPSTLALPLEMAWEYSANAGFGPGSPLLFQDRVLIATRQGEVHTIDLKTGNGRGFKRLAEVIEGSPLIADGLMFVPSAWGKDAVTAFDLRIGVKKWRAEGIPIETPLVYWKGLVIGVDVESNVTAFDAETGSHSWSFSLMEKTAVRAAPVLVGDNELFVATVDGDVFLLDLEEQQVVWQQQVGAPVYESPLWSDGALVLSTTRGTVMALDDSSGHVLWQYNSKSAMTRMGAPASDGEAIYVGATDGNIRRLNLRTGSIEWTVQLEDVVTAAPQVVGSHLFIGTLGREFYAFSCISGDVQWQTTLRGRIKSAIAVTDVGVLVLSEPKWVTYFVQEEANQ